MRNWALLVSAAVLIVFLVAIGPLAFIWSLNTLFPVLAIPYTFWTWLASAVVMTVFGPSVRVSKKA